MIPLWLNIILLIFAFNIIIVVLMQQRRPTETLAWILVLIFLPLVGILLYYLFGVPAMNRSLISPERLQQLKAYTLPYRTEGCEHHSRVISLLERVNQAYPTSGNSLSIYTRFADMFADLKRDILSARHHIHIEFFMIESDPVGDEVADLLIRKAAEGVEVRLMYDAAACWRVPGSFYRRMQQGGVKVEAFSPIFPHLSPFSNYRNHRKVVCIDGLVGYTGGMNLAERYLKGIRGGVWRDTHIRIQGPAVTELQTTFLTDWQFAGDEWVCGDAYYPSDLSNPSNPSNSSSPSLPSLPSNLLMQVVTSNPTDRWRVMDLSISQLLYSARSYIYLQSPYLVPSEAIRKSLFAAALAGVDVRIMLPEKPDKSWIVIFATRWYVEQMLTAGVRIFFYTGGYLHAKTIVTDDLITTIGSVNIDNRSLSQSFEVTDFIYDADVARRQRQIFFDDMRQCHEILLTSWRRRPWWDRLRESLCRLLAPIL